MIERSTDFIESTETIEAIYSEYLQEDTPMNMQNMSTQNPSLASCNIPSQPYEPSINDENSLVCGTVFPDLSMPYTAGWHLYDMNKTTREE